MLSADTTLVLDLEFWQYAIQLIFIPFKIIAQGLSCINRVEIIWNQARYWDLVMNVLCAFSLCRNGPFCAIKSLASFLFPVLNSFTQALSTIESLINLANLLGILWLIHSPLIREFQHSIFLRIFWLTIQLNIRIDLPYIVHNGVLVALFHDARNQLMRVNLLLSAGYLFCVNGCIMLGCYLRGQTEGFGSGLGEGFFERGNVLSFALLQGWVVHVGDFHLKWCKFIYFIFGFTIDQYQYYNYCLIQICWLILMLQYNHKKQTSLLL